MRTERQPLIVDWAMIQLDNVSKTLERTLKVLADNSTTLPLYNRVSSNFASVLLEVELLRKELHKAIHSREQT